jgi:hypothetical protein
MKVPRVSMESKAFVVFVKDDKSYDCFMIEVYLEDMVGTILVKLSLKSQQMV